jgi:hypothetical protein
MGGAAKAGAGTAGGAAAGLWGSVSAGAGSLAGYMGSTAAGLTAATAGTVAAGAAIGVGTGMLINKGTEWVTGQSASDHCADLLMGDAGRRQREALANRASTRGLVPQHIDNRKIHLQIDAKGADADEVARKVMRVLSDDATGARMGSHG